MDLHPDFSDLLSEFARFGVRYALIGGYAVGIYAKPRATKDLDLLVSGEDDNLDRLAQALQAFGAPPEVVDGARTMGPTEVLYMGRPPLRIDLLRSADGVDTEEVLHRATSLRLGKLSISLISLGDLIANKRASGRPQDLADVEALEKLEPKR
jgi:hypothetical protein